MRYNVVKGAHKILEDSPYVIKNPEKYKNNWASVFENKNPICLELGMGRGIFIIEMAKLNPDKNFIGIEIDASQTATAVQNIGTRKLNNLKILCEDANHLVDYFGKEIDTIYLTFSEPWPKKQDEKKRFTSPNYLKIYDRIFRKNKHIILKTDNKILFASSLENLSEFWYTFHRVSLDLHHDERNIPNVMTDFEVQYYKEHRPIYYVDAQYKD